MYVCREESRQLSLPMGVLMSSCLSGMGAAREIGRYWLEEKDDHPWVRLIGIISMHLSYSLISNPVCRYKQQCLGLARQNPHYSIRPKGLRPGYEKRQQDLGGRAKWAGMKLQLGFTLLQSRHVPGAGLGHVTSPFSLEKS